jgi:hypothetical protein
MKNIVINNINILKAKEPGLYNLLSKLNFGKKTDGKNVKYYDFKRDFDELFDFGELMSFLDENFIIDNKAFLHFDGDVIYENIITGTEYIMGMYPNLYREDNPKPIYTAIINYKKEADSKYKNLEYNNILGESHFEPYKNVLKINTKFSPKKRDDLKFEIYNNTPKEELEIIEKILIDDGLFKYTESLLMSALYKKFVGNLKQSLWHFVCQANSGKTAFLETIEGVVESFVTNDLRTLFAEKAKVDVNQINDSLFIIQDETTIMFNDFKFLGNETLTINAAYAKRLYRVRTPLSMLLSADDLQDVYSKQFQARIVKIYAETINVGEAIEESGILPSKFEAFGYVYVYSTLERLLEMVQNGEMNVHEIEKMVRDFIGDFIDENKVDSEDPIDVAKVEIYNWLTQLQTMRPERRAIEMSKAGVQYGILKEKSGERPCYFITGYSNIKDKFLKHVIDNNIWYEINKRDFPHFGEKKSRGYFNIDGKDVIYRNVFIIDVNTKPTPEPKKDGSKTVANPHFYALEGEDLAFAKELLGE